MTSTAADLEQTVTRAAERLLRISDQAAGRPRQPGKWSPKEVVGHLIDSASNNHQRFVRALLQDELVFEGYEQDAWVSLQQYRAAPWRDLVELWKRFNLQLARFMAVVPEDAGTRARRAHNLHQIAWESPVAEEPVTLAFFMQDYVNHLKHHLRQIDRDLAEAPAQQLRHGRWKSV